MTWGQIPALCAVLGVIGLVLIVSPALVDRLAARWEARQAHANRPRGLPRPSQYRWRDDEPCCPHTPGGPHSVLCQFSRRPVDPPIVQQAAAQATREAVAAARTGRHRPELAGPDAVSATGIMRALNTEADHLPAISRRVVKR